MKRNYDQSALKAVTLIADLCSEYDHAESTVLLINLVKAFQCKSLSHLSQNQYSKTFNFINKLTTIYLSIQQISTLQESHAGENEDELQKPLEQVSAQCSPAAVIRNFFNKYALHESQILSDVLTNTLLDSNLSQAKMLQLCDFQQDLECLLQANHLLFQPEQ
ncbi:hypothetical protein [Pedobacter sp. MC2016-24]|uniref:hypothetical protein n=1 Tax=Pedobacter sp. MC2016-24 TaxID=2780090 RepID=UPI00187E20F8|nr:hypothetical protein [Pedobacter sp. MC2016-24]MBE9598393.1 hypothetical protein [Pedobacter sp. MC2016-24]